jgi:catechol 2,3-dioxygenase-like lactoylglutathione lyase family enzyme
MRLQLALNVTDLEGAIDYYRRLFGVDVAKRKPGYANFEVEQPPLKLVLFETEGCCFATQNKAVTYAPDGTMWEWYRKLEDLEQFASNEPVTVESGCCQ